MADLKISELPAAGALTGAELIETVQGGVNKQTTTQDIADLGGGGGGTVTSVTGTTNRIAVDLTNPAVPAIDIDAAYDASKQNTLVSGTNIKTVGGTSLLGSGNISVGVGDALVANPLSQFAATTSAQLAGVISDETGSGALVFATSPTLAGTPAAPTAAAKTSTTQVATTAYVQGELRATRTVTGTDSVVQADDNSLIIFNSATPFTFTIDQLTTSSKVSFLNIGAGAVTFAAGTGVGITGGTVLDGAADPSFPGGLAFWISATAVHIVSGSGDSSSARVAVALSGSNLTLDMLNRAKRNFDLTTTLAGAMTIIFSNTTNLERSRLTLRVTGACAVTLPAACIMDTFEVSNGRFVTATNVLTLTGVTASPFVLEFVPDSAGNIWVFATNNGV